MTFWHKGKPSTDPRLMARYILVAARAREWQQAEYVLDELCKLVEAKQ